MKNETLRKYFELIKIKTRGDNSSNSDIIDYNNGLSVSIDEIEEEYYKYLDLQDEIDDYIEENDLDDLKDKEKIKEHFANIIDEDLFEYNQACLLNFENFMATKINKKNDTVRKANMIFNKNGNGFDTTKITIPVGWAKKLGFTRENKSGILIFKDDEIVLRKDYKNED